MSCWIWERASLHEARLSLSLSLSPFFKRLSLGAARFFARSVLGVTDEELLESTFVPPLRRHLDEARFAEAAELFAVGDSADEFFCVLTGECEASFPNLDLETGEAEFEHEHETKDKQLSRKGTFVGYVDFSLQRPRTFKASLPSAATLAVITTADLDALGRDAPAVLVRLQAALLKTAAQELANVTLA